MNKIEIYNIIDDYLDEKLYKKTKDIIYDIDRKSKKEFKEEHWVHYEILNYILYSSIAIFILVSSICLFGVISYNLDVAKLNEQARICLETGYGCTSNTINTDIRYDNTPIVEVKND